jgi:hypothetical protein
MATGNARRKNVKSSKGGAIAKSKTMGKPTKRAVNAIRKAVKKHKAKRVTQVVRPRVVYAADYGLMTAFHHMQRAAVVISLMEKGTGKDLRGLLERGVKLYEQAVKEDAENKLILRALGILRAAEHLSLAGLYAARDKHRQKVAPPTPEWLQKVIAETDDRLEKIANEKRGKGTDLFPVATELLRQAEDPDIHAHFAFELAMAADALCFALENGV